jgi:hypothetical protein
VRPVVEPGIRATGELSLRSAAWLRPLLGRLSEMCRTTRLQAHGLSPSYRGRLRGRRPGSPFGRAVRLPLLPRQSRVQPYGPDRRPQRREPAGSLRQRSGGFLIRAPARDPDRGTAPPGSGSALHSGLRDELPLFHPARTWRPDTAAPGAIDGLTPMGYIQPFRQLPPPAAGDATAS